VTTIESLQAKRLALIDDWSRSVGEISGEVRRLEKRIVSIAAETARKQLSGTGGSRRRPK
jgi:hypothetical protein